MLPQDQLGELADRFRWFAQETAGGSPLYQQLSRAAADDEAAIQILATAPDDRQRRPNLLFAAVHDLLLYGTGHPLADYYPSIGGQRPPDAQADRWFTDFLREHRRSLEQRVRSRATQTNEVGRCAALWPALRSVAAWANGPLVLIELGTSAGLLLHLDRYDYTNEDTQERTSRPRVTISTELRGPQPPVPSLRPSIARRVGIDLAPLDVANHDDARWLQACVWPEDTHRLDRLAAAIRVAQHHDDLDIRTGDFTELLPAVLNETEPDHTPVVLHSAALAYLVPAGRQQVDYVLAACGARHRLAAIAFEGPFIEPYLTLHNEHGQAPDGELFLLGTTTWSHGERDDRLLARAHPHGAWLQWLARRRSTS